MSGAASGPANGSANGPGVAIVTGGSRGIGRAILERLGRDGLFGINIASTPCGLPDVLDLCVDFRDAGWETEAAARLLPQVRGRGPLCLVHNAAILKKDTAITLERDSLREVLEVNVVAAAALNRMLDAQLLPGSAIVYIASTLGESAVPRTASYVVSKHALVGLMRATCQDLAGRGVHTVALCPGFTNTEMLREHLGAEPGALAMAAQRSTFDRLIEPTEIAEAVAFCARTPVLNGAVIHANLGQRNN